MGPLTLIPKSWMSWDFIVALGSSPIADIDVSAWREKGVLTVHGVTHRVFREGVMSGDFILERDGKTMGRASKPSAFRQAMVLEYAGRQYTLRKKSSWTRAFLLLDGDRLMGTLTPANMWTRRATVVLPEDWPMSLRLFVVWLTIVLWKRDADSGAVAG